MSEARLKHFGWGREGEGASTEEEAFAKNRAAQRFGGIAYLYNNAGGSFLAPLHEFPVDE